METEKPTIVLTAHGKKKSGCARDVEIRLQPVAEAHGAWNAKNRFAECAELPPVCVLPDLCSSACFI